MKTYSIKYSSLNELDEFLSEINEDFNSLLVQIFSGIKDECLLEDISLWIKGYFPEAVIIGTSTAGEILNSKVLQESIVISFTFFKETKLKAFFIQKEEYNYNQETKASIIYSSNMNVEKFLSSVEGVIVTGGIAGDYNRFKKSFVIFDGEVYSKGIVGVELINKELVVVNKYLFSWQPLNFSFKVTKAVGNKVYELNNRPILEVYKEYLGDEVVNNLPYSSIEFPLIVEDDFQKARSIIEVEDDAIVFNGEIKEGDVVKFGIANLSLFDKERREVFEELKNCNIETLFIFSSIARKKVLGDLLEEEFRSFNILSKSVGFLTYGEIYSAKKSHLLNVTTTILGLSENKKKLDRNIEYKSLSSFSLSTTALIHLVNKIIKELQKESYEKEETLALLHQYLKAIDYSYIISVTDKRGIIYDVNENFCKVSGYTKDELIGKPHSIVRHPDMPKEFFKEMWDKILNKKIWRGLIKNRRKDGKSYYVDSTIFPLLDSKGEIKGFASIRVDVTKIKSSEEKLKAILDFQDNIVVLSKKSEDKLEIEYINKKFFEIFDYKDLDDFFSKHKCICDLFIEKEGYLSKENWFKEAMKEEKMVIMKDKNNKQRIFAIKSKEIKLETDEFIVSTFKDVTELHEALLKAQAASKAKNIFLATMSHELRTPLNAIIGFSQILITKIDSLPKEMIKTYIEKINFAGKHLLSLVNNILDFTKIESGVFKLEKERINLRKLVEDTLILVEVEAQNKNITIHTSLEDVYVEGNYQYLKQAILNILSNAVKFTPKDKNIFVTLNSKFLEICDEGMGIKKEDIPKIFEPFSQLKEHQLKDIKGTGLGLAITKRIIQMHNFKLEVESEVGKGSCFKLIF